MADSSSSNINARLPKELLLDILNKLSIFDHLKAQRVCVLWYDLIKRSHAALQTRYYAQEEGPAVHYLLASDGQHNSLLCTVSDGEIVSYERKFIHVTHHGRRGQRTHTNFNPKPEDIKIRRQRNISSNIDVTATPHLDEPFYSPFHRWQDPSTLQDPQTCQDTVDVLDKSDGKKSRKMRWTEKRAQREYRRAYNNIFNTWKRQPFNFLGPTGCNGHRRSWKKQKHEVTVREIINMFVSMAVSCNVSKHKRGHYDSSRSVKSFQMIVWFGKKCGMQNIWSHMIYQRNDGTVIKT